MMVAPTFLMFGMMFGTLFGTGAVGMMGLPPGPRDAKLLSTASPDALLYLEWSERSAGKAGAKGIDGLAADPEVRQFLADVYKAIVTTVELQTARGGPQERTLGKNIPPLAKILLSRPGCLSAAIDAKDLKASGGAPGFPSWLRMVAAAKATLVINGGKDADAIAKHITELVNLLPAEKRKKGLDRQPIPIPNAPPGLELIVHRHKDYFIVGFGKGAVDQAIAGLDGKSKGLSGNAAFTAAAKRVSFDRPVNLLWINTKGIIGAVSAVMGPEVGKMVKILGLESTDAIISATGVVDGNIRTKSYFGTGGKTNGLLALFAGRGMKPADFAHVPADSDLVLGFSVNAKAILSSARQIVGAIDAGAGRDLEQFVKQFETELGLKLEEDLLAAFGDVWVLHDSKSAGGIFLTSLVASVEVKDPKKAADVFAKVRDILEERLPRGGVERGPRGRFARRPSFTLKRKPFLGETIYFLNIVGGDVPFAPAFCLTKTHLLAAPHPQALKAHLRFLKSKGKNFGERLGKDLPLPKGDAIAVSFFESRRMVRAIYALAPYFCQIAMSQLQRSGADIDIFSLPSARGILPYVGNSWSTTVRTEKGIFSEAQSGVPAAGGVTMLVVPAMIFWARASTMRRARVFDLKAGFLLPPDLKTKPTALRRRFAGFEKSLGS
jgi:hypothetical protein